MPATPAMPMQENSSLRNTFSKLRCEIMVPAVARRSPAMTTPPSHSAAIIVVPCGRSRSAELATPPGAPSAGSSSGAAVVRKSANDDVPALRYAAGSRRPTDSEPTQILPLMRLVYLHDPTAVAVIFALSGLPSLAALLHVGPHELLGVLLENLVDLVQDRVHVISELVLPLPDLLAGLGIAFLLLL